MAKYLLECPVCKRPVQVSTGVFAKKEIKCACGYSINPEAEKMTTKQCPHCGNMVTYDRSKSKSATCPVCHEKINLSNKTVRFTCPTCRKELVTDANATTYTCPQCKITIDVQARLAQEASSGKTGIVEWDAGLNDVFVYRHPVEKFNIGSQLIVHEGQKALFFRDGRGLDLFGPGRYTLETQKLPLLKGVLDFPTDSNLTFDSKIYFIRTNRLKVLWSVPKITLEDRKFGFHLDIGFSGSFEMQVKEDDESPRKFVYRIMGTSSGVKHDVPVGGGEVYNSEYIADKFRDIVITHISDLMYNIIVENDINILEIDSKKIAIANILRQKLNEIFDDYGLIIPQNLFAIPYMNIHNMDDVRRWREQQKDRVFRVRDIENKTEVARAEKGYRLLETETEQQVKILKTEGESESLKIAATAKADVMRTQAYAEADVMKAKGVAEAEVMKAKGAAEAEAYRAQATAETEEIQGKGVAGAEAYRAQAYAEADEIKAKGAISAEAYKAQALAEAEEMKAKGYTYQQETQREIGKEALKNGLPGTGGNGDGGINLNGGGGHSLMGDMIGLGVTLGTVGEIVNLTKNAITPAIKGVSSTISEATESQIAGGWSCTCGKTNINTNFCPECGSAKPERKNLDTWTCPNCGQSAISSKFCSNCGSKRPELETWDCPNCGQKNIKSKFCPECGQKRG